MTNVQVKILNGAIDKAAAKRKGAQLCLEEMINKWLEDNADAQVHQITVTPISAEWAIVTIIHEGPPKPSVYEERGVRTFG